MKLKYLLLGILIPLMMFVVIACEETDDPEDKTVPVPTITSIEPVAGYPGEEVTVTGTNFNPVHSLNLIELTDDAVFFLETVQPTAGSVTSLTFTRPNISGVGVTIDAWLAVRNLEDAEEKISDSVAIAMLPIFDIITVDSIPKTKGGVAHDAAGNLYVRGQDPGDIYKITPEGVQTYFGKTHWGEGELTVGPDGSVYACVVWGDFGTWKIPPTGGEGELFVSEAEASMPFCLDWDDDQNFYIGGADGAIYRRVDATGTVEKIFAGGGWGSPMRIYNDDIYWYTKGADSTLNGLFSAPIPAVGDTIPASSITTILASEDYGPSGLAADGMGNIYLMTNWVDKDDRTVPGMLKRITPAGVVEDVYELPTQNPNKAAWYDNKIYVAAGDLGNKVYVLHLGEEYGTGAVPSYNW